MIGSHLAGKFEDFKALGALLELDISGCKRIKCSGRTYNLEPQSGERKGGLNYDNLEFGLLKDYIGGQSESVLKEADEVAFPGGTCVITQINDNKNALELLPTMPWAGQIQKLNLSRTDAEGTKNIR